MTYLLDTHTLLWSIGQSHRLSTTARDLIRDRTNEIAVSSVSLWEISSSTESGSSSWGPWLPTTFRVIAGASDSGSSRSIPGTHPRITRFPGWWSIVILSTACWSISASARGRVSSPVTPGWCATSRTASLASGSRRRALARTGGASSLILRVRGLRPQRRGDSGAVRAPCGRRSEGGSRRARRDG